VNAPQAHLSPEKTKVAGPPGKSDASSLQLDSVKNEVGARLDSLWAWLQTDANRRLSK
jgi:hypothetical protein